MAGSVLRLSDLAPGVIEALLARYNLSLVVEPDGQAITGSFWGDSEAGLVDNRLYIRPDTPVHSALHEACHYICMDRQRRTGLHTDAGGDYDEENGVCYLQILLAAQLPSVGSDRLMQDMDSWGYSFRLGSTCAWFEQDAEDAREWLIRHGVIDENANPNWQLRE